jgi:hypothetical protein
MKRSPLDVIRGTLDVLILKTLSWGALRSYAISQSILPKLMKQARPNGERSVIGSR